MKRFLGSVIAVAVVVLGGELGRTAYAQVQFAPAQTSPTVSPYLNLVFNSRPDVPTYQTIVRPLVEGRQQIMQQQNQISSLQGQTAALSRQRPSGSQGISRSIRGTGHQTMYMNYLHYYNRR